MIPEIVNSVQQIIKYAVQYKVCTPNVCFKPNFLDKAADSNCLCVIMEKKYDDFDCVKTFDLISS